MVEIDTAFRGELRCRWKTLRQTSLSEQHIFSLIDSVVTLTTEARQRHFQKWPVLGQYIWPNPQPIPSSYDGEITMLKQWIKNRLAWIDTNMPNTGACEDWPLNLQGTLTADVYPNPLAANNTIIIKTKKSQLVYLRVTDVMGRVMHSQKINAVPVTNFIFNINTESWQKGIYFFGFSNDEGENILKKIVK
ncbi:MAG: T9SS type A sorting domain-containing protein [Bacteroidia bacterium]|nr:T9SS type A sorting domain-containing protein [Bacteroidia bacterium]